MALEPLSLARQISIAPFPISIFLNRAKVDIYYFFKFCRKIFFIIKFYKYRLLRKSFPSRHPFLRAQPLSQATRSLVQIKKLVE